MCMLSRNYLNYIPDVVERMEISLTIEAFCNLHALLIGTWWRSYDFINCAPIGAGNGLLPELDWWYSFIPLEKLKWNYN